ncbi:hypothetical protein Tco_1386211 [Tanacetum coccineum]
MTTRSRKNRKKKGHVSSGHGHIEKHEKHLGDRGNARELNNGFQRAVKTYLGEEYRHSVRRCIKIWINYNGNLMKGLLDLRMKEREVKAIKEIEKRLNEQKMQTQASLVIEGIALDDNLVAKEINSSGNDINVEKTLVETVAFGIENADIGPSYDSDTVSENNSDSISDIPNMDPVRDKEEHDYVDDEQQHAFFASLVNNLKCGVKNCTKINHEAQQANVFYEKSYEDNISRISRNRLSEEFEPLVKDVNFRLNCFEKSLVKEMKDDLKYVMSFEDEFDVKCLILDIENELFKTQFESAISESYSHVYENKIFEENSSLKNENRCLKKTINELSRQVADVKDEMTKRCAQYEKDFSKLEAQSICF